MFPVPFPFPFPFLFTTAPHASHLLLRAPCSGPRLFARSDDGGVSWATNWTANQTELPDSYCEASILSDVEGGTLLFGNPSHTRRLNYSVHASDDGEVTSCIRLPSTAACYLRPTAGAGRSRQHHLAVPTLRIPQARCPLQVGALGRARRSCTLATPRTPTWRSPATGALPCSLRRATAVTRTSRSRSGCSPYPQCERLELEANAESKPNPVCALSNSTRVLHRYTHTPSL
jgi:hypothetical protein